MRPEKYLRSPLTTVFLVFVVGLLLGYILAGSIIPAQVEQEENVENIPIWQKFKTKVQDYWLYLVILLVVVVIVYLFVSGTVKVPGRV
jgi:type II secretory pathway component PulF